MFKKRTPSTGALTGPKRLLLNGVSKQFGSTVALHPLTLEVNPGELLALLGPSGCGKTTSLRLVAGFEFPDTGSVCIDGRDVSNLPPDKRGLGMVFQNYSLFPHMSVGQNIGFGLQMAGVSRSTIAAEVQRMLDLIRLPDYGQRHIAQLSGGQQQRVALARAIVTNPAVLLLDEPLGALDKNLREEMQFEIRRLQQSLGITSVMVTHDQEEAMTMSDRIVVMNQGRILQAGPPQEVYDKPRTRFVAEFLGAANIVPCCVLGSSDAQVYLETCSAGPNRLRFNAYAASATTYRAGKTLDVAIRPEKLALDAPQPQHAVFKAHVKEHIFRGAQHSYLLDVPSLGQAIYVYQQAASQAAAPRTAGSSITVSFDPHDAVVLETEDSVEPRAQKASHIKETHLPDPMARSSDSALRSKAA